VMAGFIFVYLKKIAYAITKALLGKDPTRKRLLAALTPADLLKEDKELAQLAAENRDA